MGEHNRQFHREEDIRSSCQGCGVLNENWDLGSKNWRVRWKSLIGKKNGQGEKQTYFENANDVAHLFEDRRLVSACQAYLGEKEEG